MSFQKKTWAAGTVTKQAHVTINDTDYYVTPETRTGATALTPDDMNRIEQGIADNENSIANIIATGTGTNGTYVKLSDGTMICRGTISQNTGTGWAAVGSVYGKELEGTWNFPAAFKDSNVTLIATPNGDDSAMWIVGINCSAAAITKMKLRYHSAAENYGIKFNYIAIGKWK